MAEGSDENPGQPLNRTIVGLKLITRDVFDLTVLTLNRTIVGLKRLCSEPPVPPLPPLNRTIVGLKLMRKKKF